MAIKKGTSSLTDVRYGPTYSDYSAMKGPCDEGFHIPTAFEWSNIINMGVTLGVWTKDKAGVPDIVTYLKLPRAGEIRYSSGNPYSQGSAVCYWSVTTDGPYAISMYEYSTGFYVRNTNTRQSEAISIRAFKDETVAPDNSWTTLYDGSATAVGAGIFHNPTEGLISVSDDGTNRITIADKNVGATTVYNSGDTMSETNCGGYFQRGNNYMFPFVGGVTMSYTQIDASSYAPSTYSSSTFISYDGNWSNPANRDLRGGRTGVKQRQRSLKKIFKGATQVWPPKKHWTIANAVEAGTCPTTLSNFYDECLEFSADGLHFYTSNNATSSGPFQVDLATAWDVTSATGSTDLHSTMYYGNSWNGNGTPHWNADGSACTNAYGDTIKNFSVVTNWDLTSQLSINWTGGYSSPLDMLTSRGRKFIDNGNKIISQYSHSSNSTCATYNLGTPYDLRTIDLNSEIYYTGITWGDADYFMSEDGLHLYFVSPDINKINHYTLSTAWDVSTAALTEDLQQSSCSGIYFHEDKMYIKYRAGNVKQFTVTYSN